MKVAVGFAISDCIPEPTPVEIIPYALNNNLVLAVAKAVSYAWQDELSERNGQPAALAGQIFSSQTWSINRRIQW